MNTSFELIWGTLGFRDGVVHPPTETLDRRTLPTLLDQTPVIESWSELDILGDLPEVPVRSLEGSPDLRLNGEIGRGGMGQIFEADQYSIGRSVAVKRLHDEAGQAGIEGLIHEARIAGLLEHPNILPVHALYRDHDGRPVLVMQRIEGTDWRTLMREPEHDGWGERSEIDPLVRHVEVLLEVCSAVSYAHSRGILHRDIKPDNVMIGRFGEVVLLDWGIAAYRDRLAERPETTSVGTPAYMSPEMLDGRADERSDVYLLGACLHEALVGKPRHTGDHLYDVMASVYRSSPYAYGAGVPLELAEIANRACHEQPSQRFANVAELRVALREYLDHRVALRLVAEAVARTQEARSCREQGQRTRAVQLLTEARFGLHQVLDDWPDNAKAVAHLQRCLVEQLELAVDDGNLDEAERIAGELRSVPVGLQERVAELRAEQERLNALQELASELDPRVASRQRVLFLIFVAVLMCGLAVWVSLDFERGYGLALGVSGTATVGTLLTLAAFRKSLFQNRYNRQVMQFVALASVSIFVHRLVSMLLGLSVAQGIVGDFVVGAAVAAGAAITVATWAWWLTLLAMIAAVVSTLWPELTAYAMSGSAIVATILGVSFLWRERSRLA